MTLHRDLTGTGAMLVRLLGVGARGGLTAETTLLHVLDGVPLPMRAVHTDGADGDEGDGEASSCFEFPEAPQGADQGRLDALNADAIERELGADCWNGPRWTPAKGSKADQALNLWSTTRIDVDEIARRVGSTPGAIRSVIKKAVARGEPRSTRPPATVSEETQRAIAEAKALPLKRDRAVLLWERTDLPPREIAAVSGSTPPAVSYSLKMARREGSAAVLAGDARRAGRQNSGAQPPAEAPMEVDGVGEDCATALPSKSDDIPPAEINGGGGRADPVSDVSPERADEECAEPDDEPNSPGPVDGAFPAPHEASTPIEMGTVSQETPTLDAPAAPDTADRPAGPGLNAAGPVDQAIDAMVSGLAKKAEPRLEALLELYATTTRPQKHIGSELGLSEFKVSTLIKAGREAADPRVVAGDAARAALKAQTAAVPPPKPPKPVVAPAAPAPAPSEAAGPLAPGDLVELKHDQVLAIDRGWVVGPTGSVKGFPLINSALAALAAGDLLPAKTIAQRSGARSPDAVLQMIQFWREDLVAIGVEVVRVGPSDVRLRRKDQT